MVEIGLFLVVFIIFFFLPVSFRIYYHKLGSDDLFVFEMTFLMGLLKRRKVISLIKNTPQPVQKQTKTSGRWFFLQKARVKEVNSPYHFNTLGFQEFWQRYQNYGLGITFLTYMLPTRYHRWLLVAQRLEKKGRFHRFIWITRLGTQNMAHTSLIYGLLWSLKLGLFNTLHSHYEFKQKPNIQVVYNFQQSRWDTLFDCIFRVKLGYIIIVALIARLQARARL